MVEVITTFLMYICLTIEYMLLYPNGGDPTINFLCIISTLILIVFNVVRQSVWVINPKIKNKTIVNCILFLNLLVMILIFMIEIIWELLIIPRWVVIFITILILVHLSLVFVQQWCLYKNKLSWKQEYQLLEKRTINIEKTKYEDYLEKYFKFTFYFSLVYLFNGNQLVEFILIVIHLVFAAYTYNNAWKKGYMKNVIYESEKMKYYIVIACTSMLVIIFNRYIPNLIGMVIITLPDLLLRLYLQRYISNLLKAGIKTEVITFTIPKRNAC